MFPIYDLHADLLGCIEYNPKLDFESPEIRCSLPQLLSGNVQLQVLALGTLTQKDSTSVVQRQLLLYDALLKQYKERVVSGISHSLADEKLHFLFGIENASGILEEDEPLEKAFSRVEAIERKERILYVSLTWNHENRFGGGNASSVGLKRDGEALLEFLSGKGIAIDLSHTSDALAYDLINHIHRKSLQVVPIASHSNFRAIKEVPRNLPDEIAKEIFAMHGLVGINFVRRFVGDTEEDFLRHIQYGLDLGGERALCLGADFYGGFDLPSGVLPEKQGPRFHENYGDASCFPRFLQLLEQAISREQIARIAYKNVQAFAKTNE
jgi:membrane dipeptidase